MPAAAAAFEKKLWYEAFKCQAYLAVKKGDTMNVRTTDITKSSYHLFDVFAFTCCEETPSWEEVHFNASHNRRLWLNVKLWRSRNRGLKIFNQTLGMKEKLELLCREPWLSSMAWFKLWASINDSIVATNHSCTVWNLPIEFKDRLTWALLNHWNFITTMWYSNTGTNCSAYLTKIRSPRC